jgi:hypothetical protein
MRRVSWKNVHPNCLRHAMELCIQHAEYKKNLSKERIADLMGLSSHWVFYKWLKDGRMPANLIRPFEHVCGIDFMTQYLVSSSHKLLINIPTGKGCSAVDINDMQASFSEAVSLLIRFYQKPDQVEETVASLTSVMQEIAYHRENVSKSSSPELGLFMEDDE